MTNSYKTKKFKEWLILENVGHRDLWKKAYAKNSSFGDWVKQIFPSDHDLQKFLKRDSLELSNGTLQLTRDGRALNTSQLVNALHQAYLSLMKEKSTSVDVDRENGIHLEVRYEKPGEGGKSESGKHREKPRGFEQIAEFQPLGNEWVTFVNADLGTNSIYMVPQLAELFRGAINNVGATEREFFAMVRTAHNIPLLLKLVQTGHLYGDANMVRLYNTLVYVTHNLPKAIKAASGGKLVSPVDSPNLIQDQRPSPSDPGSSPGASDNRPLATPAGTQPSRFPTTGKTRLSFADHTIHLPSFRTFLEGLDPSTPPAATPVVAPMPPSDASSVVSPDPTSTTEAPSAPEAEEAPVKPSRGRPNPDVIQKAIQTWQTFLSNNPLFENIFTVGLKEMTIAWGEINLSFPSGKNRITPKFNLSGKNAMKELGTIGGQAMKKYIDQFINLVRNGFQTWLPAYIKNQIGEEASGQIQINAVHSVDESQILTFMEPITLNWSKQDETQSN